jgi:hypothetical protein
VAPGRVTATAAAHARAAACHCVLANTGDIYRAARLYLDVVMHVEKERAPAEYAYLQGL